MTQEPNADVKLRLSEQDIHTQWEDDYLNPERDSFYRAAFDRILDELKPADGQTLLDVGCGYCYHTTRLLGRGLRVTAVDFSDVALIHARKILDNHKDHVELRQADATDLPFPDNSFDFVLMWGVLMHIPQAERALSELARVLKPGGRLVLYEVNHRSLDVAVLEPVINVIRRFGGMEVRERKYTALGIEEWHKSESGRLVARKTDIESLNTYCNTLNLHLACRLAGEFTEVYTRISSKRWKRFLYKFNEFWFKFIGLPSLAMTNIIIYRKI